MELSGKTVLITRAASQSAELRSRLEDLGARVIECPTIQIVPPKTWKLVDDGIRRLNTYQWLLFTSANAVEQFMDRMGDRRPAIPIAVVGSATAAKLADWGLKPSLVPEEFRAEGLLAAFPENLVGTRILFPRAEVARELLPEELRRRGATLDIVTVYRTVKAFAGSIGEILASERVDCIVFTSPSTIPDDLHLLPTGTALAVIGPVTREAAQLLGLKPDIVPVESTVPGLVEAIRSHFAGNSE
ncbi:MAG TPA: uroporphyrinogen-III synthase [Terriglobia bacterium]|nr:uroporphyrinogen-III synthase [Terriglobia bacterium]